MADEFNSLHGRVEQLGLQVLDSSDTQIRVAAEDQSGPTFGAIIDTFSDLLNIEHISEQLPASFREGLEEVHLSELALDLLPERGYQFAITLAWTPFQPDNSPLPFIIKSVNLFLVVTKTRSGSSLAAELRANQIAIHNFDLDMNVGVKLPSLLLEAELVSGSGNEQNLLQKLPFPVVPEQASLDEIKIVAALRLPAITLHVAISNLLQLDFLEIEQLQADIVYRSGVGITGQAWTTIAIPYTAEDNLKLLIGGAVAQDAWSLVGGTVPDSDVKLGLLIGTLADTFGADAAAVPDFLNDLTLSHLALAYESRASHFTFGCSITHKDDDLTALISILIDMQKGNGGYQQTLRGTVQIGSNEIDLQFDRRDQSRFLVAAYQHLDAGPIALNSLVRPIAPDVVDALPKVNLNVKNVLFAFAKNEQTSAWLVALALGLELDLTKIPLIGGQLKQFKPLGISNLQVLFAGAAFSLAQVQSINGVLADLNIQPALPVPKSAQPVPAVALSAGFNLAATLDLPQKQYQLVAGGPKTKKKDQKGANGHSDKPLPQSSSSPGSSPETGATERSGPPGAPASQSGTWLDIQAKIGPIRLQKLGARLSGDRIWLLLNGSLVVGPIELAVYGMGVGVHLSDPLTLPSFTLDGLGIAYSSGPLDIAGAFLKSETPVYDDAGKPTDKMVTQYAGVVKVQAQAFSLMAVGAFGQLADGAPTLFIYGAISAEEGAGIKIGPLSITGLALGFGINRRVLVPTITGISQFPLVTMVLGQSATGDPSAAVDADDPLQVLAQMVDVLPPQAGQYFGAIGVRFSLFESLDCFGLVIVQAGHSLEISLIAVARFKRPPTGKALCYIELDILVTIKPDSGLFQLEALLANSWILDPNCHITGGFALFIWYGGAHKGDFVLSLGGYHPRFAKPDHYPSVVRLGLNWHVSDELMIKGETYFAITPSVFMAGGRLEASYDDDDISAHFIAYADLLVQWKPIHYDAQIGISLRASYETWVKTFHVTLSADLHIEGPPMHGVARLKVGPIHVTVKFGEKPDKPPLVRAWPEFGRSFLDRLDDTGQAADANDGTPRGKWALPASGQPVRGPDLLHINLTQGQIITPKKKTAAEKSGTDDSEVWRVRGDEVEFAIATVIPVTDLEIGQPTRLPPFNKGISLTLAQPMALADVSAPYQGSPRLAIRPMNHSDIQTTMRLTVAPDEPTALSVDPTRWLTQPEYTQVPAALWGNPLGSGVPTAPAAEMIPGCLTGLPRFRPPVGQPGAAIGPVQVTNLDWDDLEQRPIGLPQQIESAPGGGLAVNEAGVRAAAVSRQEILSALANAGFTEAAGFQASEGLPRPLRARPLQGNIAA